ncbi:MAG: hypothetical protein HN595_05905 [Flavobacteriaceae bacterium]|nr:hypothetical protein [Flavobacteriaceae bacterium]
MKKTFIQIFIILLTLSASNAYSAEKCEPDFEINKSTLTQNNENNSSDKGEVFVFFDQSKTMQGFTIDQPGQENLYVNIVDDIQQISENIGSDIIYQNFGTDVNPMEDRDVSKVKTKKFYECSGSSVSCDNQSSKIQEIFKIAEDYPEATHIVVTHLSLQDRQLVGSESKQIRGPLTSLLKQGKSIGIIGVMNSFNGKIDNIPTKEGEYTEYLDAETRPFYILVIGNQDNINRIKDEIVENHFSSSKENFKYALITSNPILQNLNVNKLIEENNMPASLARADNFSFNYIEDNLPVYKFSGNKKTKLEFNVNTDQIEVPGSTGVSEFSISEKVWTTNKVKCKDIKSWNEAKFGEISTISRNDKELTLNLFETKPLKKLFRGLRYFYKVDLYAEKPGKSSEREFAEWSVNSSEIEELKETNPISFKTLNLEKFVSILNAVSGDTFKKTLIASFAVNFELTK